MQRDQGRGLGCFSWQVGWGLGVPDATHRPCILTGGWHFPPISGPRSMDWESSSFPVMSYIPRASVHNRCQLLRDGGSPGAHGVSLEGQGWASDPANTWRGEPPLPLTALRKGVSAWSWGGQDAWGPQQLPEGTSCLTSLPALPALGGLQTSEDPNPAGPEPTAAVAGVRDHLRIEARNPRSLGEEDKGHSGPGCRTCLLTHSALPVRRALGVPGPWRMSELACC